MSKITKCSCDDEHTVQCEYAFDCPEHYDGVSEYMCTNCDQRVGRWSGKILAKDELELRSARFRDED